MPAWRIAPPKRCFSIRARAISSAGAGEDRAERAAEPLREAQRDGVEEAADLVGAAAARDGRVGEAGAVEVHREAELARGVDDRLELLERPDACRPSELWVFSSASSDGCGECSAVGRVDRGAELLGRDPAERAGQAARQQAGVQRRARRARRS